MNKLFLKIAGLTLGVAMSIGAGVAIGAHKGEFKQAKADGTTDVEYTVGDYNAGTQYAENESHVLDSVLTVVTNQAHFTTQIRLYQNGANSGAVTDNWVKFNSLKKISKIVLNANCSTSKSTTTLKLSGSNDGGVNYTEITNFTTASGTTYSNLTADFGTGVTYKSLKLVNTGEKQARIQRFTITYVNEEAVVDDVTISGPVSISSGYLGYKNVQYTADVIYSSGQGDESVTWSTDSSYNTINANGILHVTKNETIVITATSAEDTSVSRNFAVTINGLVDGGFITQSFDITKDNFGSNAITSDSAGTPVVIEKDNVSFSIDKDSSTNNPGYYVGDPVSIRLYSGSSTTVSAKDGSLMYFVSLKSVGAGNQLSGANITLSTGSFTIDQNGVAMIDLSVSPVSSFTMTATAQARFDTVSVSYLTVAPSDKTVVQGFVDDYMHMTDYDPDLDNTGGDLSCLGPTGYYMTAKGALTALTSSQISLFRSDSDFENAKERYEAWALAYGDSTPYETTVGGSQNINRKTPANNSMLIIIIASSIALISAAGVTLLILKKKHR